MLPESFFSSHGFQSDVQATGGVLCGQSLTTCDGQPFLGFRHTARLPSWSILRSLAFVSAWNLPSSTSWPTPTHIFEERVILTQSGAPDQPTCPQ